ncbi:MULTISPECIES: hypothetical protein [unclassified Okeania]|nr:MULTISPECIES: hypothetical protein [unclassified Okeania]NES93440.1 hypothetical protein [Okeania sp. SIO2B9]NET77915.1 hypothetical protein [Okeania sp. SIO1F9]
MVKPKSLLDILEIASLHSVPVAMTTPKRHCEERSNPIILVGWVER